MTRSLVATVSLAFLFSGAVFAQDQAQPAANRNAAVRASKSLTVSGKVSEDGRSLLTDLDSEWLVSNAEALKGREGKLVTVKCYIESDHNQIHILSVRTASDVKYASRIGDSAFRR
jgi:hypothetical protein